MKIIQHFFQTILMLASIGVVALLPPDKAATYINPILAISIACLLIFTAIYLYRGHKKGLFIFIILIFSLLNSANVSAQVSNEAYQKVVSGVQNHWADFKKAIDEFDPKEAVKTNTEPPQDIIDKAVKFIDIVDYALNIGLLKRDWYDYYSLKAADDRMSWWDDSDSFGFDDEYSDWYEWAHDFLEEVAEYRILQKETQMDNVYNILKTDKDSCWPCGIIRLMIDTVEKITLPMEAHLKQAALTLLGIMTLFWLLTKVLILIGQFGTASNADFFTELLIRLFLVVVAAAILQAPLGQFYRITFSPMVSATTKLTQQFGRYSDETQGIGTTLAGGENLKCACCENNSDSDCDGGKLIEYGALYNNGQFAGVVDMKNHQGSDVYEGLLDLEAKRDLMCMTCSIYKQTAPMVAAGRVLVNFSLETGPEKLSFWRKALNTIIEFVSGIIFPYPMGMWFVGIILIIVFTWLAINIAFKAIDIFLRFGFVVLLTPFLVTTYVFPISRKYTQRGWEFLVHSMVSLLALGIGTAFVMAIFMTGIPEDFQGTIRSIMSKTTADMGNYYASDLWHAFISAPQNTAWDSGKGGSFFSLLWMIVICFMGTKVLNATSVIVEALSGISCGIPSIAGSAVMGAIRAAYAPFKMAKKVTQDRLDAIKPKDPMDNDKKSKKSSKGGKFVDKSIEKAGEVAGDTVEKTGAAAGKSVQGAGKGMTAGGQGLIKSGAALSGSGIGAIIGVPLMIAGAAVAGAGYATQAAGHAIEKGSKVAGKAIKTISKVTAKAVRTGSRVAAKVKKTMKDMSQKAKAIKNRMKKMIPPKLRKKYKNWRKNRRKQSASKYRRARASNLLDNVDNTIENALNAGDNSFGQE
jgi:hypothetical protein